MKEFFETKVDSIGRFTIPDELKEVLKQYSSDVSMKIIEEQIEICLTAKSEVRCEICQETYRKDDGIKDIKGHKICIDCIEAIKNDEILSVRDKESEPTYLMDENGRCYIPKPIREKLGINGNSGLMIRFDKTNDSINLKPIPCCLICGNEKVMAFGNVYICIDCLNELS